MSVTSISGGSAPNVNVYGAGTVVAGDGNHAVNISGTGAVTIGNGRDTISIGGNGTVSAGSGNNLIGIVGSGSISVGGGADTLTLRASGQIIETGVSGHDTINLGSGNDTVVVQGSATVSSATYYSGAGRGGHGVVFAVPNAGGATISGGSLTVTHSNGVTQDVALSGKMTLIGGATLTSFVGGTGSTLMKGGSGHDTFVGGSGNDTMSGVGNHNVFDFVASPQGGQNVITNFVSGDQLNIEGHSLAYFMAQNQLTSHNGNTYISVNGGQTTIELQGVVTGGHVQDPINRRS